MLEKYIVCDACGLTSPPPPPPPPPHTHTHTHSYISSVQELIMEGMQQPPKYLIIVVNRFRYINNNLTKDRCSIPMDVTIVLGLHKFSLQATIDHHVPCILAIILPLSTVAKIILLQRQQNYGVWNNWYKKLLYCLSGYVKIDYIMAFGLEQEDGSFDYSHGSGTPSPSH